MDPFLHPDKKAESPYDPPSKWRLTNPAVSLSTIRDRIQHDMDAEVQIQRRIIQKLNQSILIDH